MSAALFFRVMLLIALATTFAGCEVVGGIFKAGMWVGAITVILVIVGIGFVVVKLKG